MIYLLDIGFLSFSLWDLLDIAIVGYLIYRIYLLLRGSIAFNIFIGVIVLYVIWWLVRVLKMDMLALILDQFVSVGFIIIIIIFQPEVRRFLLLLGNTTQKGRNSFLGRWLLTNVESAPDKQSHILALKSALVRMSKAKTGALIVFSKNLELDSICHNYVELDAQISESLLLSIFQKESPLHDGAVVIGHNRILAAGGILPVSESSSLPESAGLRHRAATGLTERTSAVSFVVSEENGSLSFAEDGRLEVGISKARLTELLDEHFN
ncbi:MAG: TIGR00159 family protein [Saprospiraceae bacterium]|nr:MAG: TIGR00159 family protein [Saprospiraceae bacterium]